MKMNIAKYVGESCFDKMFETLPPLYPIRIWASSPRNPTHPRLVMQDSYAYETQVNSLNS